MQEREKKDTVPPSQGHRGWSWKHQRKLAFGSLELTPEPIPFVSLCV